MSNKMTMEEALEATKNICLTDTETTGLNTGYIYIDNFPVLINEDIAEIIEIAGMSFGKNGYEGFYTDICKPQKTIVGPVSAATHGYTNKQLMNAKLFDELEAVEKFKKDVESGKYIVAHNMPFDEKMFNIHGIFLNKDKTIDTLRVSKHCFKDGLVGLEGTSYEHLNGTKPENHTLQYFRYLYEMDDQPYFKQAMKMANLTEIKPHTALSDVFILWIYTSLLMVLFDLTLEDMVALTKKPVLEEKFTYGSKAKKLDKTYEEYIYGEDIAPWGAVQAGYNSIMWAYETAPMSVDTEYSFIYHMSKAMLNGRVPFIKDKKYDFKPFLYYGIKYCFDESEIERALLIMGKDSSFIQTILTNMERKVEEHMKEGLPENTPLLEEDKYLSARENKWFLHNYAKEFRMDILSKFL